MTLRKSLFFTALFSLLVAGCGLEGDTSEFPKNPDDVRKERVGKLTGEDGILLSGSEKKGDEGNNPLGVNSFLWRATLDTLAFMPLASADPFGGVVLTDWYEDPKARGERFKVNALILDRQLRADSVKVRMFKQKQDEKTKQWLDQTVDDATNRKLEDAILTRARQLRVAQLGY
ncbi:MAG: DUF3576 domain-containing protein [Alphaproteobacteria bacterium]|nr:DUF3576 domain-containing protein [Alphaproteobacteria bacterium]